MDLKYITPTQVLELTYEGRPRRFTVVSASVKKATDQRTVDDITLDFANLAVQSPYQLWTIGWDTSVSVVGETNRHENAEKLKVGIFSFFAFFVVPMGDSCDSSAAGD